MRVCSICRHRRLTQIDQALLRCQPQAAVARTFGVSPDAISRHSKHMQSALVRAKTRQDGDELRYGDKLLREIDRIRQDAERLQDESEQRRDVRSALRAIHERLAVVELEAKLSGRIIRVPNAVFRRAIITNDQGTRGALATSWALTCMPGANSSVPRTIT